MKLTGAEIIMEVLIEQGVTDIFGYPGGTVLNIYEALYNRSDKIHHYLTAHEQGAAHAADGYARATGKTGVVLCTSGPGVTNTVTGIATAYLDSIPMVIITANVGIDYIGKDSFQEVFIAGITQPITKHNYAVRDITKLADTVRDAFKIAGSGRKGPVLIDIPKEHPKLAGKQLYLDLKARGILVRHFDMPRILDYNRITIGTPEQMETLLKTLREMI